MSMREPAQPPEVGIAVGFEWRPPAGRETAGAPRNWETCMSHAWSKRIVPMSFIALIAALGLSACNTVEGAGKDIESGGQAIQNTAEDVKK